MGKVFVAGSINMDIVAMADHFPLAGETVLGNNLSFYPGGKGANQAIASAKLGAETFLIGKLGNDYFAKPLEDFLKLNKVNIDYVERLSGLASGTALVVVDGKGENRIVVVGGANNNLNKLDIDRVDFGPTDILISQGESPTDAIEYFFIRGKQAGARIIFNPAPAKTDAKKLFKLADILVLNESELTFFSGIKISEESAMIQVARDLRQSPSQIIILTLGAEGVFVLDGEREYKISAQKVNVVDTTGAGDCFVGALASQLVKNVDLENAVSYANAAASISVQRAGAGPSMPTSDEVNKIL